MRPMGLQPVAVVVFVGVGNGLVENLAVQAIGHERLGDKMVRTFVAVLVALAKTHVAVQIGYGIAQGFGNRGKAILPANEIQSLVDGQVGGIAFGAEAEVKHGLAKQDAGFRIAYFGHALHVGLRQDHRLRIGKTYILGGQNEQPSSNKDRVFTALHQPGQVINGGLGI